MKTARVNGAELHYTDGGAPDGQAVVFANSLGTDLRVWDAVLPHLPPDLRVIRYDKRGHGLSEETPGPYSIDILADDAAGLMDHLGLRGAVFVGLSIGGLIGQALAARRPDLLRGLVISNSAARIGDAGMWQGRIDAIRSGGLRAIAAPTMERWFSPEFRREGAAAPWQRMLERQPQDGYIACCEAIAAADLSESTAKLDLPVRLIAGRLDGSTPPDLVAATARLIPGARLEVMEGVGHIPCVEAPEIYAAILSDFIEETP
ncbi:3-oxoadipate enol-lactonase [Roseovarius aquimarinus]|uniref:3-oxoadipate enol-lactonase n=1 Tax=Roseovarius aquimarinus TaxID=1229156 RepID=A0ABW7I5U6_9RHOB